MMRVPTPGPNGWTLQADGVSLAEMADDFQTAHHADRAAVLAAYTLLGAAINGFAPVGHTVLVSAIAGLLPHCRRN
ncbi:MAG: hypothetical protein ACLQLO_25275 [Mycobacterium sp.]